MKLHKTIYYKFIAVYVVFAILAFIAVSTITSSMTLRHLSQRQADSLYREASMLANSYAKQIYSGSITIDAAESQLKAVDTYINCPIWVINTSGKVIINTREIVQEKNNFVIENFDPTEANDNYVIGDFFGTFNEETLSVFSPITKGYEVKGYVVIHTPMKSIHESTEGILNISYITMIIILLLSLSILIVFSKVVYIPLTKITKATDEYAKGNYDYSIDVRNNGEMGYLANTLEYMASEIDRTEENQKKFIANVSHDFKSPLTSIKGYIEAMLDGTIPLELHEKYLGIVLNETERLTKLTGSLLQLNNLNIKGIILDFKDFDINKVIKRTCETFGGRCMERHIQIELLLIGEELIVHGDENKLSQVIYNLLDNAIKFSHDNSSIVIETSEKNDKVFVSVKDSGVGIPKESQSLVFDRFYKTDSSRGKDKKGTGLGLSIAKEIIKAHEENINVISTEGVGTEFIFTVAKAK